MNSRLCMPFILQRNKRGLKLHCSSLIGHLLFLAWGFLSGSFCWGFMPGGFLSCHREFYGISLKQFDFYFFISLYI